MENAGQRLKRARERLNLRYRDVEQASLRIAELRQNDEFLIALSRLSDIENKGTVPTIYRLYSLCAIYRLDMAEVLEWYGVDLAVLPADAAALPLESTHLLDVGGASGTWTIAFLEANPSGTATIFDLPHVIPMARKRLRKLGLSGRVRAVAGDFYRDELPRGADLAWVSAIVHQNSREQNRRLFRKVFRALEPGGRIAIRDVVMEESRTAPVSGALFAVNMLVGTPGGGTFTFRELKEDLRRAGFAGVRLARRGEGNDSVLVARR